MEGGTSPPYPPNYGLLSQKVENLGSNLHLACSHQVVESPEAPCPPPLPPEVSSWRRNRVPSAGLWWRWWMLRCLEEGSKSSPYPPNYIWREELVSGGRRN